MSFSKVENLRRNLVVNSLNKCTSFIDFCDFFLNILIMFDLPLNYVFYENMFNILRKIMG